MQRILAIAWLTWKAAFRFRLFLVLVVLLLGAVVGLPLIIQDDGTARGFTQIILTYTLSVVTGLLGLSTLWLACGTLARDIEECQIQVVATKPIARWQIWLGKWIGLMSLNAVLLALAGGCIFGVLEWRATKLPPAEQAKLHSEILVARGSAREPVDTAELNAQTERILAERLKANPVAKGFIPEVRHQVQAQVQAALQLVPSGYQRTWQINLGFAKNFLKGKPLQLRVKFNAAEKSPSGTDVALWQIGDPNSGNVVRLAPMSLSPDTFHEFEIPPDLYDASGLLTITFVNQNPSALLFPLDDGMEVLYPEGGFAMNFARGLGIIFCWMALMAALGLMAASFLSFPVAAFFSMAMLLVALSSGTLAASVQSGTVAAGNEETGEAGHSAADLVLIPAFKGILAVIQLVKSFSPVDALSSGRAITWGELIAAFAQIVLLVGGVFAVAGIWLFHRRELATAQGTS